MAHISLVTLGVDDVARSTAYYTALGWRTSSASVAETVTFLHGTPALALYRRDALSQDLGVILPAGSGAAAMAMNLPSRNAVDEAAGAALAAGGTVVQPPAAAEWGGYSGYVADPDGHLWELAHNPGFPLDELGHVTLP